MMEWTEQGVIDLIVNPIYAGIPPFPAHVSDEKWIGAMKARMQAVGPDQALAEMLTVLRQTYAHVVETLR